MVTTNPSKTAYILHTVFERANIDTLSRMETCHISACGVHKFRPTTI
jgi:hypothetical protein